MDQQLHSKNSEVPILWSDAASGVEYIDAQEIVHLDIKPQNILLHEGSRGAVICDFGISVAIYHQCISPVHAWDSNVTSGPLVLLCFSSLV